MENEDYIKQIVRHFQHAKEHSWKCITADTLLSRAPCLLAYAILTADGGVADVTLYDGYDNTGEKVTDIEARTDQSMIVDFDELLSCDKGLYVDVGSNVGSFLIVWHEIPQGKGWNL